MRLLALLWLLLGLVASGALAKPFEPKTTVTGLSVSPSQLTLPSEGFHYDPLITPRGADGKPLWVNLPVDLRATSSDTEVATVDSRIRIRTGRPGTSTITIHSTANPNIRVSPSLTVVKATIEEVQVVGDRGFELFVGETRPLEATARLSTGQVIPHCEYSSDLDVVLGEEFATLVDGLGIAGLRPVSYTHLTLPTSDLV